MAQRRSLNNLCISPVLPIVQEASLTILNENRKAFVHEKIGIEDDEAKTQR